MTARDNGGPAFPITREIKVGSSTELHICDGMTLRDYFAAKALQGMCADPVYQPTNMTDVGVVAYGLADIMLAERAK